MLYKRKNSKYWWCRFTAPDGTRIQQSTKTVNRKEAQEFEDRLRAQLWRVQQLGDRPRRHWKEAVMRWHDEARHKKSIADDLSHLRWLDQYLGDKYLDEISRELLDTIGANKLATGVKPATVNRMLEVVRAILNKACREWEWIDRVPHVRMLKEPKRRIRWLTEAEVSQLLSHLPPHLAVMVRFTLATGLRENNVTGLEWSQVDLERRVAWIHADQAKAGRPIGIPLNADALQILAEQRGKHARYVFTYRGRPVKKCNTRAWRQALLKAGIQDFRWHDLRHTWASWHVQRGTPLHVLQELGGWSDIRMVQRYAHLAPEHLAPFADRLCGTPDIAGTFSATPVPAAGEPPSTDEG